MAGSGNIGTVYVNVAPSTSGFAKQLGAAGNSGGVSAGGMFKQSFGSIVGGSAIGNILASGFTRAMDAVSSSMGAAISRVDTIANFPKVMQNLGYGAEEAQASINALSTGIDGLPTSLDGIVSMTQQLAPLCGGMEKATSLSLAMNNMFLASGASTADQTRAMQQYTQMLSRGKVELNDWRTLQEVMPGQLNQVASAMLGAGKNSTDLYEALKAGKVSMDDFNDAVLQLNQEGTNGFASFSEQAKTSTEGIGTAMENVQNRIAKAVGKFIDHLGQANISGVINGFSSQFSVLADKAIQIWDGMISQIDFAGFEVAFSELRDAVGGLFATGDTATTFGEQVGNAINMLIPLVHGLTPFAQMAALAIKLLADNASWLIPVIVILFAAFRGASVINAAAGFLQVFTGKVKLAKTPTAQTAKEMLSVGAAALLVGAGVALACAGVWLLANASIALAQQGGVAVVVMFSMVAVVAALAAVFALLAPRLNSGAVGMLALGASLLMVAAGIAILTACALALSQAGTPAVLIMVGMVVVVGLLAAAFSVLGPALTAGSVGMLAFGAAVLMVGVAMLLMAAGVAIVSISLPLLVEYGFSGAAALAALGGGTMICAAGLLLLGVGALVAGVGVLVFAAGLAVAAAAVLLLSGGVVALGAAVMVLGAGLMVCAMGALMLGTGLILAGNGLMLIASNGGAAAAALTPLGGAALMAAPGIAALAPAMMAAGGGAVALASGAVGATAACMAMSAALIATNLALLLIGQGVRAAQSHVSSATTRMRADLESLKNRTTSICSQIQSSFSNMRLHIPSPTLGPMPHFSMVGRFDPQSGEVPRIDVNWYARGAIFSGPSIIGVGEAGNEAVLPLDNASATRPLAAQIADVVSERSAERDERMLDALMAILQILGSIYNAIPSRETDRQFARRVREVVG